jgi:hypothetical protein
MAETYYRNEVYRDYLLKVPYPFDSNFSYIVEDVYIGTDIFLDALFYIKQDVTLPISILTIDGTYGTETQVRLEFADALGTAIGYAVIESEAERANVLNPDGINIGVLVLSIDGSGRFVTATKTRYFNLTPGDLTFHMDTCKVSEVRAVRYVATAEGATYGTQVQIVARHGVQWRMDGDVLALDLLGELPSSTSQQVVLSVNGVANPSIWLNATPTNNLRLRTTQAGLHFGQAKDLTEGAL